jgi:ureidoacrylate peracid hydrolase
MNGLDIPEAFEERVIRCCGRTHPHEDLQGRQTALVVIDLQNALLDDAVGHAACPMAREIVPEVNRLAAAVWEARGGVFWIKNTYDSRSATEWSQSSNRVQEAGDLAVHEKAAPTR